MFNFQCPECGKGQVRPTVRKDYQTKVRGVPLSVDEAVIGVCEECAAEFFDPTELRRWSALQLAFEEQQLLAHNEIADIRGALRMTIGQFARLLGCTRQSIYNWERPDRSAPQLRTADLLLRLVRESLRRGNFDVIDYLKREQAILLESPARPQERPSRIPPAEPLRRPARQGFHVRPSKDFDRLFGLTAPGPNLPLLSASVN